MLINRAKLTFTTSIFTILFIFGCSQINLLQIGDASSQAIRSSSWEHLSSSHGDFPVPSGSREQTAALIMDVDGDGTNDLVIGIRKPPGPSLVWYKRDNDGWRKYLIDDTPLDIEAGGAYADIDRDGDLDIVMGGDYQSNQVWWWENPYPNYEENTPWVRREIKNSGSNKHHDQIFGDFTGDGEVELIFWNQGAQSLFLAEIPADPKTTQPWPYTALYTWEGGAEHEGLAKADIDGDGLLDIIGGGRWFKYQGGNEFTPHVIDDQQRFRRVAAGQLKEGGAPEVVFVAGDGLGRLKWYEWDGENWNGSDLLGYDVDHGHSLELGDLNGDGHLDIFVAEMRLNGGNPDAKMWIFIGDGLGNFQQTEVATGLGNHESRIGDLDGDGDLDILGKPYNWETPRLDMWLNVYNPHLGEWRRHVIDVERPWTSIFITSADIDGDSQVDIVTGGWWYQNPGTPGGVWGRYTIGAPLNNMAAVYDFDGDGDMDILGTTGEGSNPNSSFVWARNDGAGVFTILENIPAADGDFLQGVVVERFHGRELGVALSWHAGGKGIPMLTVPTNPSQGEWDWNVISPSSQDEALSAGDIDRDGDVDLLLGTQWLRNDGPDGWEVLILHEDNGLPDRNQLADINGDGRLDAVVGYEAISIPGKLTWYEQGISPEATWTEHTIADPAIIGPMSLGVADMDGDGDLDVVAGEHNPDNPGSAGLYVFENLDGLGTEWDRHIVYMGDEHHDGAHLVDIDNDGDLDILSIGWTHKRVLLYENLANTGPKKSPSQEFLPYVQSEPTEKQEETLLADTPGSDPSEAEVPTLEQPSARIEEPAKVDTPADLSVGGDEYVPFNRSLLGSFIRTMAPWLIGFLGVVVALLFGAAFIWSRRTKRG
jgi:hypothetical protein